MIAETTRSVRFEESDPLGIAWHGRYLSYFEDGRAEFGKKYGLSYLDMYKQGFLAPVAQLHVDYYQPLMMYETFTINTSLHYTDAVRLNFSYLIQNEKNEVVCSGYSVQLITTLDMKVLLARNDYLEEFWRKWRENDWV